MIRGRKQAHARSGATRRVGLFVLLAWSVASASVDACSSGNSANGGGTLGPPCDRTLPTCPASNAPTYSGTVLDIILRRCLPCHFTGSAIASQDLSDYGKVFAERGSIFDQVYACAMPTADAGQLAPADRTALITWLQCGAPND